MEKLFKSGDSFNCDRNHTIFIVYPLAGLVVLWLLPLEFEVAFTVFIALACPAGASVIMFAQRYDRDAYYASEIFVITTLLSAVTIPLLSVVAVSLLS